MTYTWFMDPRDPRRVAEEARQRRLIRQLEAAAARAGINTRLRPVRETVND